MVSDGSCVDTKGRGDPESVVVWEWLIPLDSDLYSRLVDSRNRIVAPFLNDA